MSPHGSQRYLSLPDGHAWKVIDHRTDAVLVFDDSMQAGLFETEAVALATGLNDFLDTATRCRARRLARAARIVTGSQANDAMPAQRPATRAGAATRPGRAGSRS